MFKTKRKRAVVLALIAFFCTAATTYVAVDWRRFGGGFLAFLKGKGEARLASTGAGQPSGSRGDPLADADASHSDSASLPQMAAALPHRRHTTDVSGGAAGAKPNDDLFVYGDPAAGGIQPGSFIVARNDAPSGGNNGGGAGPAPSPAGAPESGGTPAADAGEGGSSGSGVSSPAPPPTTGTGGSGDSGLPIVGQAPPPPTSTPPASTPTVPTPSPPPPTQSGTSDSNTPPPPPDDGTPTTPGSPSPVPPVSAVPEASSLAMMSLGALFLAVAAQRKRKNG